MMEESEKKARLLDVIKGAIPSAHCQGCDEWGCEHHDDDDELAAQAAFDEIWAEIQSWEKANA